MSPELGLRMPVEILAAKKRVEVAGIHVTDEFLDLAVVLSIVRLPLSGSLLPSVLAHKRPDLGLKPLPSPHHS